MTRIIPWTEEEMNILRENYITKRGNIMKELPNRTRSAINTQASKLGLRHRNILRHIELTDTEAAYIAGIVDGEGSINMNAFRKQPIPQVSIANTDIRLINWLMEKLKSLNPHLYTRPATETQKPVYKIYVANNASVQALLERIVPYMVIKKERAEVMMEFTSTRVGVSVHTPYDFDPMITIEKIRQLNRRGPNNTVLEMGERT